MWSASYTRRVDTAASVSGTNCKWNADRGCFSAATLSGVGAPSTGTIAPVTMASIISVVVRMCRSQHHFQLQVLPTVEPKRKRKPDMGF